ncbi:hypothetical protein CsSME_00023711 [Camellia sinensis var. sinensis]
MRVCYHGSRTLGSLVSFYDDVTEISQAISNENKVTFLGLKTEPLNGTYLERIGQSSDDGKNNHPEQESCPFSWARSPENLLQPETYLALATAFVLLRLLYFLLPTLSACTRLVWRLYIPNMKLKELVGTSSGLSESSNPVIQFPKGALQEKQFARGSDEC